MTLDTISEPNVPSMVVRQKAYLDANIRCGLFEGSTGNRYLVGWDTGVKFAVALTHHDLPAFTTQYLNRSAIDYGRWWGPCRLRLTSAEEGDTPDEQPGKVGIGDQYASLLCRSPAGRVNWMPLGYVGKVGRVSVTTMAGPSRRSRAAFASSNDHRQPTSIWERWN